MNGTSRLRSPIERLSAPIVDILLAVALAVAMTIAIDAAPPQGRAPDALAYGLVGSIAAVSLFRRRWPLATLLASVLLLQTYNLFDYPGLFAAVPLSVSLATAWSAGHLPWALAVGVWYAVTPFGFMAYQAVFEDRTVALLGDALPDAAMMAAVLLLGEAIRTRRALETEKARSERLLLNILPGPIADRLKDGEGVIADAFPEATVMFADLVDYTRRSDRVDPADMVQALDDLFSRFDALAEQHGLEKIKTIGDAYMVAAGIPIPRQDHAEAMAEMALDIRDETSERVDPEGRPLAVRIGIDTGPVVAGVIGRTKFIYDLWGDTVNTASRMESFGVSGRIQVTERIFERLRPNYRFESRGSIEVKGKGEMSTYFLLGRK